MINHFVTAPFFIVLSQAIYLRRMWELPLAFNEFIKHIIPFNDIVLKRKPKMNP